MMKDRISQIATITLWIIAVFLWINKDLWYLATGIFILHFIEVFLKGIKIGRQAQKSNIYSVIMTLIFGFTWWLPLHKSLNK